MLCLNKCRNFWLVILLCSSWGCKLSSTNKIPRESPSRPTDFTNYLFLCFIIMLIFLLIYSSVLLSHWSTKFLGKSVKKLLHVIIFLGLILSILLRLIWIDVQGGKGLNDRDPALSYSKSVAICALGAFESVSIDPDKTFLRNYLYANYLKLGCKNRSFSIKEYIYYSEGFLVFIILLCAYLCRFFSGSWTLPLVASSFLLNRSRISSLTLVASDTVMMMTLCCLWAVSLAFWLRTGNAKTLVLHTFWAIILVLLEPALWGLSLGLVCFMLLASLMHERGIVFVKAKYLQERSLDEILGIAGLWQLIGLPKTIGKKEGINSLYDQGSALCWLKITFFEWLSQPGRIKKLLSYSVFITCFLFIISRPWDQYYYLFTEWNYRLALAKLFQINNDNLSFLY